MPVIEAQRASILVPRDHRHINQNSVLEQLDGGLRLGAALSGEENRPRGRRAVSDRSGSGVSASMRA
jgi:hypothetical protein